MRHRPLSRCTPTAPLRTPSAAGCLLATGVFALVAAGLTFTAFAWSFLGSFGQLMVLVIAGVAAMVGGHLLARRIPGTANALSVTGVLLLVVAAGFLLDADSLGSPWFRAFGVVVAAAGGRRRGLPPGASAARPSRW